MYNKEQEPIDLLILETNDEFNAIFGKDKTQFSGSRMSEISPEFAKRLSYGIKEKIYKIANKPFYEAEIYVESRNTWYDIYAKIVDTDSLVVLYSDSSKRKIVEQELTESHKTFKNLYENAAVGLFRVSLEGSILMANKTFHQILGISSYEILMEENDIHFGKNALKRKLPKETDPKNKSIYETYWEDNNGRSIHLLESYQPIRDKNSNPIFYEGVIENISERKAAETQILELNNLFAELGVNPLKNIQLIVKKTNEILKGTVSIFYQRDKGRDSLVTWPQAIFDLEPTDSTDGNNSLCFEITLNGIEKVEVIPDLKKTDFYQTDSRVKKYGFRSFIGYPVMLDGSTIGSLCMADSIPRNFTHTESNIIQTLSTALSLELKRHKLEENLREARNEAEIANKAKTQFLANMSHELRTPLNGILGFSEMLIEFETDDNKLEMLEMIEKSGDQLLQIINDIFDYSKLEAGKLTLTEEEFELREMMSGIVKFFDHSIRKKNLEVFINTDDVEVNQLYGDYFKIKQVLVNIVSNAIKFTDEGSIDITIKTVAQNGNIMAHFIIEDTGIGIDQNEIDKIFDEFKQLDNYLIKKIKGTGLGLAIAKQLIVLLNGSIHVESEPEKGSKFYIEIPLVAKTTTKTEVIMETPNKHDPMKTREVKILLAEDNEANQFLIKALTKSKNWDITVVDDGEKVVEEFRKDTFDIVLMDVQMPIMNGYEATRLIREIESERGTHTPIIALTAYAMKSDKDLCLEAGMDDYISKPFKRQQFLDTIAKRLDEQERV